MKSIIRTLFAVAVVTLLSPPVRADFTPGDFYASNYFSNTIIHYDSSGAVIDSFTVPSSVSDELRGLAFGPDRLLYAVASFNQGIAVLALDSDGQVHDMYPFSEGWIGGNLSYGKIAFDQNGSFYVGTSGGLVRFDLDDPFSGTWVTKTSDVFAVRALPSGNLLIASAYNISEITNTGSFVRSIQSTGIFFVDLRGLEYDASSDTIFATMLGYTGNEFQLMRLDGTTGELEAQASFWYGDDICLASDGRLIVGSRTQSPGIFTEDLDQLGSFDGSERMFVTQVPELPSSSR